MAKHKADSQVTLILNHLKSGREINPKEALANYGCFRLGAVIFVLTKPSGKKGHYAVYKLEEN